MGRIERGFRLVGSSWRVLKADRELMWLPIISFLAIAAMAATFFLPFAGSIESPENGAFHPRGRGSASFTN